MAENTKTPAFWEDYVLRTGDVIQHIPEFLRLSDDRVSALAKVMNDELATHNANTNKLVDAFGLNTKVIGDQAEALRLHTAATDSCLMEVKDGIARDQRTIDWFKEVFKWIVVVAVGGIVAIAGGGEVFKMLQGFILGPFGAG